MGINTKEYCGTIVLEVDGKEYEIISADVTEKTGRKLVKTMNRKKRSLGSSCGSSEFEIKIEAAIPLDSSEPAWRKMTKATLTMYPACDEASGKREVYTGCFTTEIGSKYDVENEARRSLTIGALDFVEM